MLGNGLSAFIAPICLVTCLWIIRFAEMSLFHKSEVTRRRSSADVIDHFQSLLFYATAWLLLSKRRSILNLSLSTCHPITITPLSHLTLRRCPSTLRQWRGGAT